MQFLPPIAITDVMMTASSLAEDDYPAWSAATVYAVGERVILTSAHRVYQRLNAGSGPTPPNLDTTNWVDAGPTNKWAPFDRSVGSEASSGGATTLSYTITPGQVVTGLALLDASCDSISIQVSVSGDVIYEREYSPLLTSDASVGDWYAYFFESIERRASLFDAQLPAFSEAVIGIALSGTAPLKLGTLVLGRPYTIGATLARSRLSINDFSVKSTDEFGVTTLTERAFSRRMEANISIPTASVNVIAQRMADIRAKPVVWIDSESVGEIMLYGWCKEWLIEMQYQNISNCSLLIEGLV